MVEFQHISKTYRVAKRQAGFGNAVRALFSREYEIVHALQDVSFSIGDGEMVGYIGPNGAGKSTTIKIMCGVLTPDSGQCIIDGRVPWKNRVAHVREIGVVFGQRSQLWWDVPVIDSFELIRDMYRLEKPAYTKNLEELTELLDLRELLKTPARNLSLGQRMRCEIAASLLHGPKTLFLDEPTIGLDAVSKIAVRQFIKRLNEEKGTTVILLIGRGRLLLDGSLEKLKRRASGKKRLTLEFSGSVPKLHRGMTLEEAGEERMVIGLDPEVLAVSEAIAYLSAQTELTDVSVSGISTEELVASLYKEYRI